MPVGEVGSLGLAAAAVLLLLALAARRRWRLAAARRAEVERLAWLAVREAAEAEAEMEALALGRAAAGYCFGPGSGYNYAAATDTVERPQQCEVCFRPTSTRCSRCKAVKYCSGKCQIIHWRQGHKDVCHPPQLDDPHNAEGIFFESKGERIEQANLYPDSLDDEEKLHPVETSKRAPSETNPPSIVAGEDDEIEVEAFVDTSATGHILDPCTPSPFFQHAVVSSLKGMSDGTRTEKDVSPFRNARRESGDISSNNIGKAVKRNEEMFAAPPEFPSDSLSVNGDASTSILGQKTSTCEVKVAEIASHVFSVSRLSGSCAFAKPSEDTAECPVAILESNVAQRDNNTTNPEILQRDDCIWFDTGFSSKPSNLLDECIPSSVNLGDDNSPNGAVLLDGRAQSDNRIARNLGCDKSVSSVCGRKDDLSLLKSEESRPLSSIFSANNVSSNDGVNPTLTDASLKVNNTSPVPANSSSRRGSLPNAISHWKTSMSRAVQHVKSSNYLRQYPSEFGNDIFGKHKMLFPYDLFIKLYNCDKVEFRPCGLQNCGNSCYANAVLQCLTFTRPLTAYLLQGLHTKTCLKEVWCFTCELESLILKAKEGKSPLSPIGILSNIGSNLGHGREEDAHEFLRHAIDTMQSACLKEAGANIPDSLAEETTLIQLTFGGYLRSKIKCMKCHGKSVRNERMLDLTVEIHGDIGTLEEALRRFTTSEVLDGDNKYQCNSCKTYARAKKKMTILEAPNILTVALKRFQSGKFGKLNKAVRFPEYLNLAPYMSGRDDKFPVYQLYAVVVHRDTMNATFSGHYVCYVKSTEGKWYKINDSLVKSVELEKVLRKTAYLLFYARCSPRGPSLLRKTMMPHDQLRVKKSRCRGSYPGCGEGSSSSSTRSSPLIPRSFGSSVPFDARFNCPYTDTSSDSSLLSCSDEGSCSTDSTRDSTSTEFSDFIFGDSSRRFNLNSPFRFLEGSDDFTPTSSHSSDAVLNYDDDHVVVDGVGDRQPLGSRVVVTKGNDSPPFLYTDTTNHQCRKSLTKEGSSRETDWDNPFEVKSNLLMRRPMRERTDRTFY